LDGFTDSESRYYRAEYAGPWSVFQNLLIHVKLVAGTEGAVMTKSLSGAQDLLLGGAKGAPIRWTSRMQGKVTTVGVKVIPWIPNGAKRVLSGGRSIVIDGNTLDPTLQLMLASGHAVGIDGLVIDDDVAVSRTQLRAMTTSLPGPQIHVTVNDISL